MLFVYGLNYALSRVLNQIVKTRIFKDFQLMDNLNMTA